MSTLINMRMNHGSRAMLAVDAAEVERRARSLSGRSAAASEGLHNTTALSQI